MASSCGKEYCPDTKCAFKHPFNGGKRARCERIKGCQNSICAPLAALGPNGLVLYDTCIQQCHSDEGDPNYPARYGDYNKYLCTLYAPEDIVEYYGINPCGANPANTPSGQKEQTRQQLSQSNNKVLIAIGALLLISLLLFLLKKR
jgi:LPXTG-motif cell wall-anchored protein